MRNWNADQLLTVSRRAFARASLAADSLHACELEAMGIRRLRTASSSLTTLCEVRGDGLKLFTSCGRIERRIALIQPRV